MSQNKTIVSGVDYNKIGEEDYPEIYGSLYSRESTDSKKTYVPGTGMPEPNVQLSQSASPAVVNEQPLATRIVKMQNRMVVGVLFSISRDMLGEIFPLYLGRNVIGQADNCDICLKEQTVSSEHAILYIRKESFPTIHYEMTLTDYASTYGTLVNEQDGRYEQLGVKENDIITIGKHYKFILKMFDTDNNGLKEDEEFEGVTSTRSQGAASYGNETPIMSNDFYAPSPKEGDSSRTVIY